MIHKNNNRGVFLELLVAAKKYHQIFYVPQTLNIQSHFFKIDTWIEM